MASVFARTVSVSKLTPTDTDQLFGIFKKYYDGAIREIFETDLAKKTDIILVRDKKNKRIVGFSTITQYKFKSDDGKTRLGIFSGDTIIEKEYWGNHALQFAFGIYCFKFLLKHPFAEKYWLLISKGYKTYMLLTNNFVDHYPHPTRNQDLKPLVKEYSMALFPGNYNEETGILDFGDNYQKLKGDVAVITDEMKAANPKIRMFDDLNPGWREGKELPCIGKINMRAAYWYFFVKLAKKRKANKQAKMDDKQRKAGCL